MRCCRMTRDKLQGKNKKDLAGMARRQGIPGTGAMDKDQLIKAILSAAKKSGKPVAAKRPLKVAAKKTKPVLRRTKINAKTRLRSRSRTKPQLAAAHNTSRNGHYSAEEIVERSKYDVGVPTKDLSVKVPKDLPAGYGKDRSVCTVRDPYWLHCYCELPRQRVA